MGAAVEISTGDIDPIHLEGKKVMLGDEELGVLDGSQRVVQFDISSGKHVLYLRKGLTTSGAVAFRVQAGHCAQVTIADTETDEEKRYQIVGDLEADIKQGLIAISSPVARAMIGKHEGDSISIDAPGGTRDYDIVSVEYVG